MLTKKNREDLSHLGGVFNKTIILLVLVGYEMIIANEARSASTKIIVNLHIGAVVKGEESYAALTRHVLSNTPEHQP